MIEEIIRDFDNYKNLEKSKELMRYFKTGVGEYGEGDIFYGLSVPQTRVLAKKYSRIDFPDLEILLESKIHEMRLLALIILVNKFVRGNDSTRFKIYQFYLSHTSKINNWDLVDTSAGKIVGAYLLDKKDRSVLYTLSKSKNLWERRISIIATMSFINQSQFEDALHLCEDLLDDKHDLIHKAVGWVLREVGKKDIAALIQFLNNNHSNMPRTALRYSIERLAEHDRLHYLNL